MSRDGAQFSGLVMPHVLLAIGCPDECVVSNNTRRAAKTFLEAAGDTEMGSAGLQAPGMSRPTVKHNCKGGRLEGESCFKSCKNKYF